MRGETAVDYFAAACFEDLGEAVGNHFLAVALND